MNFQSTDREAFATRRLGFAVAASLLLHVLLLWPAPLRSPDREAPGTLHATMRSRQPDAMPLPAKTAPPRAVPSAPTPASPPAAAPVVPFESHAQGSVPRAPAAAAEGPTQAGPVTASANPVAASGSSAAASSPAAGPALAVPANSADTLDGLRGYRLAVAGQARRFKRYPADARASGRTGSTEVRLEVGGDGTPRPSTVSRSSGHDSLDRAALAMIDAGAARARLPNSLRGRGFTVLLPVVFSLDDE